MQSLLEGSSQVCATWRVADVVGRFTRKALIVQMFGIVCSSIASGLMKSFLLEIEYRTVVSLLLPFGAVWQRETFAANPELLVFSFGNCVNLVECPHSFLHCKLVFPYSLLSNLFISFCFTVRGTEFVGIRKMILIPSFWCFTGASLRVTKPFSRDFGMQLLCQGGCRNISSPLKQWIYLQDCRTRNGASLLVS